MNSVVQDFTKGLNKNINKIKEELHESSELFVRQIQLDQNGDNIGALGIVTIHLTRLTNLTTPCFMTNFPNFQKLDR